MKYHFQKDAYKIRQSVPKNLQQQTTTDISYHLSFSSRKDCTACIYKAISGLSNEVGWKLNCYSHRNSISEWMKVPSARRHCMHC
ncbi:MAG: hypothetical protein WKG06_16550 [Segetibacter sp.]